MKQKGRRDGVQSIDECDVDSNIKVNSVVTENNSLVTARLSKLWLSQLPIKKPTFIKKGRKQQK